MVILKRQYLFKKEEPNKFVWNKASGNDSSHEFQYTTFLHEKKNYKESDNKTLKVDKGKGKLNLMIYYTYNQKLIKRRQKEKD